MPETPPGPAELHTPIPQPPIIVAPAPKSAASQPLQGSPATSFPPLRAYPQPIRQPSRASRVAFPRGVLAVTALSGLAAAFLIPVDRPGIGWLLAGLVTAAAIVAVDTTARRAPVAETALTDAPPSSGDAKSTRATDIPANERKKSEDSVPTPVAADDAPDAAAGVEAATRDNDPGADTSTGAERPTNTATNSTDAEVIDTAESPSSTPPSDSIPSETLDIANTEDSSDGGADPSASVTRPSAPTPTQLPATRGWAPLWWSGMALALLAVGTVRAADWLFVLCVLTAMAVGSLAVVRRSMYGVLFDMVAVPLTAVSFAPPWLYYGVERVRQRRMSSNQRVWWSLLATALLLVVFVPLLAGADAVFATLVDALVPALDMAVVWRWVLVGSIAALGTAGALYLLAGPPPPATNTVAGQPGSRRLSRLEWGLPVGAVTVLFAVFVATQLAVLFGGDGYVQRTAELTYAEYARSGFWQLSIVSMLTLAVIVVVQRWAAQESGSDRLWLRAALTAVSLLTLVIVASALSRMWTYQQAYGFTVMRLLVEVFELWIALLYLLVLAGLVRLRRQWLPRAAVGAAATTLLALAILNPEHFVADRNIDRWQSGRTLDTEYLSGLSADAIPAADRLPEPLRAEVVNPIRARLDADPWQGWNLSRSSAR